MKLTRNRVLHLGLYLAVFVAVFGMVYSMLGQQPEEAPPNLFEALLGDSVEELQAALDAGADPNATEDGLTPLQMALLLKPVSDISYTQIRALLEAGANPNITDESGWTALHYAAKYEGGDAITQLLVDHGGDAAIQNQDSVIAVHLAAVFGNVGAMSILEDVSDHRPQGYEKIKAMGLANNAADAGGTEQEKKAIFSRELLKLVESGVLSDEYREAALQGWADAGCVTCDTNEQAEQKGSLR